MTASRKVLGLNLNGITTAQHSDPEVLHNGTVHIHTETYINQDAQPWISALAQEEVGLGVGQAILIADLHLIVIESGVPLYDAYLLKGLYYRFSKALEGSWQLLPTDEYLRFTKLIDVTENAKLDLQRSNGIFHKDDSATR